VSFGLLAFLGAVLLSAVVAFGLTTLLRATPTPWVANPLPVVAALALLARVAGAHDSFAPSLANGLERVSGFIAQSSGPNQTIEKQE